MDYSLVKKVEELINPKEVNRYLDLGWKLLQVYTTATDTDNPFVKDQCAFYVVGWTEGEPKYPEPDQSNKSGIKPRFAG